MRVVRVESKRGLGPYRWVFNRKNLLRLGVPYELYDAAHCAPLPHAIVGRELIPPSRRKEYRYGCASEYELIRFFGPEVLMYLISKHHYYLASYEVTSDYLTSFHQVMFRLSSATRISRKNLKILLPKVTEALCSTGM